MRVLVTGAGGFAGRWLSRELEAAGHEAIAAPSSQRLDVSDASAVCRLVVDTDPDGVVHLAAVSLGSEAAADPERALRVNVGGTLAILEAVRRGPRPVPVVVAGSSEVYAPPTPDALPLDEDAPLGPTRVYGLSKLAAEALAVQAALHSRLPTAVARSFNHTGPGQRDDFIVPALAGRIVAAAAEGRDTIRAGNVDVRRDIGDVRDVVRAYRLLLEGLDAGRVEPGRVYNVATGRAVAIRDLVAQLAALAGVTVEVTTDPSLVRAGEPIEIRGDASRIGREVGWAPSIPIADTLRDMLADAEARRSMEAARSA